MGGVLGGVVAWAGVCERGGCGLKVGGEEERAVVEVGVGFEDGVDGLGEAVIKEADVVGGVGHRLEETGFVVEANGIFVAPTWGHGHVVNGAVD